MRIHNILVLRLGQRGLELLLIKRGRLPFVGQYAFPGGKVNADESAEEAAQRELAEETGLENLHLEQVATFSKPERDPRGRFVSVAFVSVLDDPHAYAQAGDDAAEAEWFPVNALPELAFDHSEIVEYAMTHWINYLVPMGEKELTGARDRRYDATLAWLIASQQRFGGLMLPYVIKSLLSPMGGPSIQGIAAYMREHQVDMSASEREVVVRVVSELSIRRAPITPVKIQHVVQERFCHTLDLARIEEILSTIDVDVVNQLAPVLSKPDSATQRSKALVEVHQ